MYGGQPDVSGGDQSCQPQGRRARPWPLAPGVSRGRHAKQGDPKREPHDGTRRPARCVAEHRGPGCQELSDIGSPGKRNSDQTEEYGRAATFWQPPRNASATVPRWRPPRCNRQAGGGLRRGSYLCCSSCRPRPDARCRHKMTGRCNRQSRCHSSRRANSTSRR
jgi:hypothetical protein